MKKSKAKKLGIVPLSRGGKKKQIKKTQPADKDIEKVLLNIFKGINKKQVQAISTLCKLKKISKSLNISKNDLQNKKYKFLTKYHCLIMENICFTFVETNYRKVIIELFYPNYLLDLGIFEFLSEALFALPRNTKLILIPKNLLDYPEVNEVLQQYKIDLENQRRRDFLIEIANSKSLDSINRLLYFLYQYWKKLSGHQNNTEFIPLPNKKIISYIIGNSHEVIIRNFKKLEKMNYFVSQGNKIKINYQRVEKWRENSKIII